MNDVDIFHDQYSGVGGAYIVVDDERVPRNPETGEPMTDDEDDLPE